MESNMLLILAAGYAVKAVTETTTSGLLREFGSWLKKNIFPTKPKLAQELTQHPSDENLQIQLIDALRKALRDPAFKKELTEQVQQLQAAGIKEKNIVRSAIEYIEGNVHIGDKDQDPGEYDRKNIVEGDVRHIKGNFTLGDGHDS